MRTPRSIEVRGGERPVLHQGDTLYSTMTYTIHSDGSFEVDGTPASWVLRADDALVYYPDANGEWQQT